MKWFFISLATTYVSNAAFTNWQYLSINMAVSEPSQTQIEADAVLFFLDIFTFTT